jgi:hypothetical protein
MQLIRDNHGRCNHSVVNPMNQRSNNNQSFISIMRRPEQSMKRVVGWINKLIIAPEKDGRGIERGGRLVGEVAGWAQKAFSTF